MSKPFLRNLVILAISAVIGLVLVVNVSQAWAITWALLSAIVLFLFSLGLETAYLPKEFKRLRADMAGAARTARRNSTLKMVLDQIVSELEGEVARLHEYKYEDDKGTIPELSIKTVQSVKAGAFATFVADEREKIYEDREGKDYLASWFDKTKQLGKDSLHRVFVVGKLREITEETARLIAEHLEHGSKVSVIDRTTAENISSGCELDFGLFDSDCLMTVRPRPGTSSKLSVYVVGPDGENGKIVEVYEEFKKRLVADASSAENVLKEFRKPINAHFWDLRMLKHNERLGPPHGLSQIDAKKILDLALGSTPGSSRVRVAILGVTPQLVDICVAEPRIQEIVLLDQTLVEVDVARYGGKVRRERCNWLEYAAKMPFEAILGDESLNNLTVAQYRSFFSAMRRSLQPLGSLVMRTLGRYEDSDRFLHVPANKLLETILDAQSRKPDLDRDAQVIEFLHSENIAFDKERQLIETRRYNDLLRTWITGREITEDQAKAFWFPSKEDDQQIQLSSAHSKDILETSSDYFSPKPFADVDLSYCGSNRGLKSLYQITHFIVPNP
jgi:hypothetical protein